MAARSFRSEPGGPSTGPGGDVIAVRATDAEFVSVTNSTFAILRGGGGGNGATGAIGATGDPVPNAIIGNGLTGNPGGTGGPGGDGSRGGSAVGVQLLGATGTVHLSQNIFHEIRGGGGGDGGRGGQGGLGGRGGRGGGGFVGGDGGPGGTGGRGGSGGTGGVAIAFDIVDSTGRAFVANNLVLGVEAGDPGDAGGPGPAGIGGPGGSGGSGAFDEDGDPGDQGPLGSAGSSSGAPGAEGSVRFVRGRQVPPPPPGVLAAIVVSNNIAELIGPTSVSGPVRGFENRGPGVMDARNNIVSGANIFATGGPFTTNVSQFTSDTLPQFIDAANGDYRLVPGQFPVDSGLNEALSPSITRDIAGNPRYQDDPNAPWLSSFFPAPRVDYGLFESPGIGCFVDFNGNGRVDEADVLAVLSDPAFDRNGDAVSDFFDVLAYLEVFDSGFCGN